MSEMVDRVAVALEEMFKSAVSASAGIPFRDTAVSLPNPRIWDTYARAAIEAMREPTDEMVQSGVSEDQTDDVYRDIRGIFGAMIDAALQD